MPLLISKDQAGISKLPVFRQVAVGKNPSALPMYVCKHVLIQADGNNTASIYVSTGTNTQNSAKLRPRDSIMVPVANSASILIYGDADGQLAYATISSADQPPTLNPSSVEIYSSPDSRQQPVGITATQMPDLPCKIVFIKNNDGSTQNVRIGGPNITISNGFELRPGQGISFTCGNANIFYAVAAGLGATIDLISMS